MKCQIVCSQKIGFDISCQLSPKKTIGMKCQILRRQLASNVKSYFLEKKIRKIKLNLSSAESVVKVKKDQQIGRL